MQARAGQSSLKNVECYYGYSTSPPGLIVNLHDKGNLCLKLGCGVSLSIHSHCIHNRIRLQVRSAGRFIEDFIQSSFTNFLVHTWEEVTMALTRLGVWSTERRKLSVLV